MKGPEIGDDITVNIGKEIALLKGMTVTELRKRYVKVFGEESRSRHKDYLIKRIVWRLQSLAEGDLSERARRRAMELANNSNIRMNAPKPHTKPNSDRTTTGKLNLPGNNRLPMPGAVLTRQYKGRNIVVTVLPKGFEYEGEVYRSLSAVAKAVTASIPFVE